MKRPGRRRSLPDVRFEGFPDDDGLWWLRWFDYHGPGDGVASSPKLRVLFSRLEGRPREDALPVLDGTLAASRMPQAVAYVQSGWLPVLSIGLVVRAGRVVGQLGATVERFAFQASTHRARVEPLVARGTFVPDRARAPGRPASSPASPGGPPKGMSLLLSPLAYPLREVGNGHLLSIRGRPGDAHLVLPCPEVFRAAYAPHRILALALLSGPWGATARRVLDPGATAAAGGTGTTDPYWRVAPAEGLGAAHATVAANLWLNPAGRAAAERVWRAVLDPSGGAIEAALPFEWDTIEVEAACVALSPRGPGLRPTMLGYAITSLRWPDPPMGPPPKVEWLPARTVRERGADVLVEPEGPNYFVRASTAVDEGAEVLEGVQHLDASAGPSVSVEADGPRWTNAPEVARMPPRPARSVGTGRGPATVEETARVSAGAGARGRTGAATAQAQALDPFGGGRVPADRFTRVLATLDALATAKTIASHVELAPPRSQAARRGPLAVWAFPVVPIPRGAGVERWYMRSLRHRPPLYADVRRTAMVRSIIVGGSIVHWIETEPRGPDDHHRSLVFSQDGATHLTTVVTGLLRLAAEKRGRWPEPAELPALTIAESGAGVRRAAVWRHTGVIPDEDAAQDPVPAAIFNPRTALAAILDAASG